MGEFIFRAPPGWPEPSPGWKPPAGWAPDPSWPPAPAGWIFWIAAPEQPAEPATDPSRRIERVTGEAPASQAADSGVVAGRGDLYEHDVQSGFLEVQSSLIAAQAEIARLRAAVADNRDFDSAAIDLEDGRVLQEVGIYEYHHPLENAEAYKERLKDLRARIKDAVKEGTAIKSSDAFTFNNSLAKGRKMTADLSKLMLRAYNAEAENCVRVLRAGNVVTAKKRLDAAAEAIIKLGALVQLGISPEYHALRHEELGLTADYLMKVQEEREAAREERARLREERKAQQELAEERERLDKEREHFLNALAAIRANGDEVAALELEAKVASIDEAIARNDYRIANIRAGYVYVISNRGAFGPNIVKIGLTRRLEPMERVVELGDC